MMLICYDNIFYTLISHNNMYPPSLTSLILKGYESYVHFGYIWSKKKIVFLFPGSVHCWWSENVNFLLFFEFFNAL